MTDRQPVPTSDTAQLSSETSGSDGTVRHGPVCSEFGPGAGRTAVLRVYEASGSATPDVKIRMHTRLASAREVNLLEDAGRRLQVQNDTVQFDLQPFEIKTIKLKIERGGAR